MTHFLKQVVIDKCVFEKGSIEKLEKFVRTHFLILPDALYYECGTTDTDKEKLLDRFRSVILAGAYTCPSIVDIIKKEANNLSPYGFLVKLEEVSAVRKTFQKNPRPYSLKHAEIMLKEEYDMAENILKSAHKFTDKLALEDPQLLREVRKWNSSRNARHKRLQKWAELVDGNDIHKAACRLLGWLTQNPDTYCLSSDWISWQYLRLIFILFYEKTFLTHVGAQFSERTVEHDLQDMKYVLLLSRADALLTKDDGCLYLAKAAFPDKDIFSNLDEVPEEYVCQWS
jgi:hypothetical protein